MTMEEDLVLTPDESRLLGCVYVDPPEKAGADAQVCMWWEDWDALPDAGS
jgi:hypothetical protein